MKPLLLTAVIFPAILFGQQSDPQTTNHASIVNRVQSAQPAAGSQSAIQLLPDNYEVSLVMTDKDGQPTEVSVVAASSQFQASPGEPSLRFNGTLKVEESGNVVISYQVEWEFPVAVGGRSTQFKPASVQGSVRLKLGEEVQIIRAGNRTARLSIKKLETAKPK